jgi:hypothetical protein
MTLCVQIFISDAIFQALQRRQTNRQKPLWNRLFCDVQKFHRADDAATHRLIACVRRLRFRKHNN